MILISKDWKHRYDIWEIWDYEKDFILFIGLNPATRFSGGLVTRCKNLAKDWKYGGVHIVNLFSYRTTNPKELFKQKYLTNEVNDNRIKELIKEAGLIVACWGNLGKFKNRDLEVIAMINSENKEIYSLGLTQLGYPCHAAYVKRGVKLILWNGIKKNG